MMKIYAMQNYKRNNKYGMVNSFPHFIYLYSLKEYFNA